MSNLSHLTQFSFQGANLSGPSFQRLGKAMPGVKKLTGLKAEVSNENQDSVTLAAGVFGSVNKPGFLHTPFGRGEDHGKPYTMMVVNDRDGTKNLQLKVDRDEDGTTQVHVTNPSARGKATSVSMEFPDVSAINPGLLDKTGLGSEGLGSVIVGRRGDDVWIIAGDKSFAMSSGQPTTPRDLGIHTV